jgi:hypothetical protein
VASIANTVYDSDDVASQSTASGQRTAQEANFKGNGLDDGFEDEADGQGVPSLAVLGDDAPQVIALAVCGMLFMHFPSLFKGWLHGDWRSESQCQ